MALPTLGYLMLDKQPDLSDISTHFRAGSDTHGIGPYIVLTIVPILLGVGLTAFYQHYKGAVPGTRAADRLFAELCHAHKLSRGEIRLLRRVARTLEDMDTATIFLLQQRFDEAAEAFCEEHPQKKTTAAIESLRGRLFGCEPLEEPKV